MSPRILEKRQHPLSLPTVRTCDNTPIFSRQLSIAQCPLFIAYLICSIAGNLAISCFGCYQALLVKDPKQLGDDCELLAAISSTRFELFVQFIDLFEAFVGLLD